MASLIENLKLTFNTHLSVAIVIKMYLLAQNKLVRLLEIISGMFLRARLINNTGLKPEAYSANSKNTKHFSY